MLKQISLIILASTITASTANAQWVTPPASAPGVEQRLFESDAAGEVVSYHIFLPPEYHSNPCQRFPVLYWLHGAGASTLGIAPLSQLYANAMEQELIPPMLIVFPNGLPFSMWSDAVAGDVPMESVVINELIPEIDSAFRTLPQRKARIIDGFSMGGYGAARLGFRHNHLFAGVSILGAAAMHDDFLDPPPGGAIPLAVRIQVFEQVWGSDPEIYAAQSPWNIAQQTAQQLIDSSTTIRLAVGQLDSVFPPNLAFQSHLETLNIPHASYFPPDIDHNPIQLLLSLGPENWNFYKQALEGIEPQSSPDLNNDGLVNLDDLNLVLTNFGTTTSNGDADGNGVVNLDDLNIVLTNFGTVCN